MVFLVHKLAFHNNHNHHPSEAFLVSLQAFRSHVSNSLAKLVLNSDPGSELFSIKWLQECFEVLPIVNQAFAKLVVEIDYPMTKWEVSCIEEYLSHSMSLLDSLNSISSALSQLSQARVSLSHALSVNKSFPDEYKPIKKIMYKKFSNDLKVINGIGESKRKSVGGKELVLHEALLVLKSIGSWVCSVVVSGLCSDFEPYMKIKKSAGRYVLSPLIALDSIVYKKMVANNEVLKELKAVNDAVQGRTQEVETTRAKTVATQCRFFTLTHAPPRAENSLTKGVSHGVSFGTQIGSLCNRKRYLRDLTNKEISREATRLKVQ